MRGEQIPDADHISRYCGGSHVKPDGKISGVAFQIKERFGQPEEYLSVNWLEYLGKDNRQAEILEIRNILNNKLQHIGSKARIAVLNVGELRDHVLKNRRGTPGDRYRTPDACGRRREMLS